MKILEKIKLDMRGALKKRKNDVLIVLRSLIAKLKNNEISKGRELNEDEVIRVIRTSIKQIKESINIYKKAKRYELAEKEELELMIIESYVPDMLSDEQIQDLVEKAIIKVKAKSLRDMGKVMPIIMKEGGPLIDGNKAREILKQLLE